MFGGAPQSTSFRDVLDKSENHVLTAGAEKHLFLSSFGAKKSIKIRKRVLGQKVTFFNLQKS
jgi:hypothetical protein